MRKWILGLLTLCLLTGCSSELDLQKQTFTIELGQDVHANPALYVKDSENVNLDDVSVVPITNGIRKKENRFVSGSSDFLVVGEYDFKLVYGNQETKFRIKIKDTQPPTFNDSVTDITIAAGDSIEWQEYLNASDLSGVSFESSPTIDTSVKQVTAIRVRISDRFGNSVDKTVNVHVE